MARLTAGEQDLYGFRWVTEELPDSRFRIQVTGDTSRRHLGGEPGDAGVCAFPPLPSERCETILWADWWGGLPPRLVREGSPASVYIDRVVVYSWADLDAAALAVAGALRAWRIADPALVSVEQAQCIILTER